MENRFDELCKDLRSKIKLLAEEVRVDLREAAVHSARLEPSEVPNLAEVYANITLVYRHLEDAAMRLGKAIQARDGGVSIYDRRDEAGRGPSPKAD
jgi:hypothetical protein